MSHISRPKIAIAGRIAESTSANRASAVISAERLAAAVYKAGGEPLIYMPALGSDFSDRLTNISGVLIPGGGDVDPSFYGQEPTTEKLYGRNKISDEFDLELSKFALDSGIPLLAICRGAQIVNVLRGGTLVQHLETPHVNHIADIQVFAHQDDLGLKNNTINAYCFHHQAVADLGAGLEVIATSTDGLIEAFKIDSSNWAYGVQWHPEDNYLIEQNQFGIFQKFVSEAAKFAVQHGWGIA